MRNRQGEVLCYIRFFMPFPQKSNFGFMMENIELDTISWKRRCMSPKLLGLKMVIEILSAA